MNWLNSILMHPCASMGIMVWGLRLIYDLNIKEMSGFFVLLCGICGLILSLITRKSDD